MVPKFSLKPPDWLATRPNVFRIFDCTSRRRTEGSAGSRGMKTILVVPRRDGFRDLAFHFHPHMIGQRQLFAGSAAAFRERQDGWKNGHSRVNEQAIDAVLGDRELGVVEIIRVNRNAVHESRETRRRFSGRSYDGGFYIADAEVLKVLPAQSSGLGPGARKRQSQPVQYGLLPQLDDFRRNILVFRLRDKFGDVVREAESFGKISVCGRSSAIHGTSEHAGSNRA